jgi:hypothetical protein
MDVVQNLLSTFDIFSLKRHSAFKCCMGDGILHKTGIVVALKKKLS